MHVVIVGGGIGGLVTALVLWDAGIPCEVHERSSAIRGLGVGIDLLPQAVAPLAGLGLLDRLDGIAIRIGELRYAHRLGPEIVRRACGRAAGHPMPQFAVHRGRLLTRLYEAVRERGIPVHTGHRLARFAQDDGAVRARFTDAAGATVGEAEGDILIGADGIHSTVRAALFPGEGPPRWNGVIMWRGATDRPAYLDGHTMIVAGGTAAKLILCPIAPGATPRTRLTSWTICVSTAAPGTPPPVRPDWTRQGELREVLAHRERFDSPYVDVAGLVTATPAFFEYPMCDRDPLPYWTHGRVTLLGDAAHPMYPTGPGGASQAILDAVALRDRLRTEPGPVAALRAYDDARRPATAEAVLRNRTGGPERVIDEVERRAPDGFTHLADVIDRAAINDMLAGHRAASDRPDRRRG